MNTTNPSSNYTSKLKGPLMSTVHSRKSPSRRLDPEAHADAGLIVHALKYGGALCGRHGIPTEWGQNEAFLRFDAPEIERLTCNACRRALRLAPRPDGHTPPTPELSDEEAMAGLASFKKKHPALTGVKMKAAKSGYVITVERLTNAQMEILLSFVEAFRDPAALAQHVRSAAARMAKR